MNFKRIIISYIYCFFVRDFDLENAADDARKKLMPKGWKSELRLQDEAYELKSLLVLNNPYLLLSREWDKLAVQFPKMNYTLNTDGHIFCKIRDSGAATLRFQLNFEAKDGAPLEEANLLLLSELGRGWRKYEDRAMLTASERL